MGLAALPFAPGDVIDGKFRVERLLGAGGMGTVFGAVSIEGGARVAIKMMNPAASKDRIKVQRFLREGRALIQLKSVHTARVNDVGRLSSGEPYLVMEYLQGSDLSSLIDERGHLETPEAVDYVLQACEALAEAHCAGIVHRDLKPANLFLAGAPDEPQRIKLLDFGLAKIESDAGVALTLTNVAFGSPRYISPEQLRGAKDADERSDIWSLGVTLYELLTGIAPFHASTVTEICRRITTDEPDSLGRIAPRVPAELAAVVMRCLEKDSSRRYENVSQFAQALAPFAQASGRVERIVRTRFPNGEDRPVKPPSPRTQSAPSHPDPAETRAPRGASSRPRPAAKRRIPTWLVWPLVSGAGVGTLLGLALLLRARVDYEPPPLPPAPSLAAPHESESAVTTLRIAARTEPTSAAVSDAGPLQSDPRDGQP